MVAHVELPALDPAKVPSTFSQPTIDGLLRHDLGFNGLVYTDSMSMAAIAGDLPERPPRAPLKAPISSRIRRTMWRQRQVSGAFDRGEITMARIDASVRRVLTAKARLG
jgi:beta-N-acetylhexosaminidase